MVAPSRGRGSKLVIGPARELAGRRPFTGARIETRCRPAGRSSRRSPLHGGADRNRSQARGPSGVRVAPSRGRGSKRTPRRALARAGCRPFTGARIETSISPARPRSRPSPLHGARIETWPANARRRARKVAPSRGRGSKQSSLTPPTASIRSPLHGGADRNALTIHVIALTSCRPFTGARIETSRISSVSSVQPVAPSRGRGSKLVSPLRAALPLMSPLHGGADRNSCAWINAQVATVAPSRGRGSKPRDRRQGLERGRSPLHGVRIETPKRMPTSRTPGGHPLTGAQISSARSRTWGMVRRPPTTGRVARDTQRRAGPRGSGLGPIVDAAKVMLCPKGSR